MRSELVTQAEKSVSNRFLLVHVTTAVTRKFHRPTKDRLPETINSALAGLGEGKYVSAGNVVGIGTVDRGWFNGFTGEGQYSYVNAAGELAASDLVIPAEDEPTPEERMAVCSAIIGAPATAETA